MHKNHPIMKDQQRRKMRKFNLWRKAMVAFSLILLSGLLLHLPAHAGAKDNKPFTISGNWITEEGDAIVAIKNCGESYCGRIARYLIIPPGGVDQRDIYNPNKALRKRKLLGAAILTGFKPATKDWRGRIYDPKSGKSYRSIVRLQSAKKLLVKGCLGPFCQTQVWTRSK